MLSFNRRALKRFLVWAGAIALALGLLGGGTVLWRLSQAQQSNVGRLTFANRLAIPPLLEATRDERGRTVFNLTVRAGETELLPGTRTPTWGVNGTYLSPTLRASRGDEVVINVTNDLDTPTSLHWHGMHLPAAMDGGPHQQIQPGETWSPTWTVNQPAATLWFHPHLHGTTAEHVYRGVAGMFLLEDDVSHALALPKTYGVDDVPLVIQDKHFNRDGSLSMAEHTFSQVGILGDEIFVNGTHAPYFEASTTLVRFRVLNASNARVYNLGFTDDRAYWVIGTDAGLLDAPVSMTRLQLSPGERAEIVVPVSRGDEVTLRSFPPDLGLPTWAELTNGGNDSFDILRLRAGDELAESPPLPEVLAPIDRPDEASAVTTRIFELSGHSRINGQEMDMSRIDDVVTVDSTEIWEIRNTSNVYHNFHVHLVRFTVLDIDGEEPPPHLQGWKDTVFLSQGSRVRIIARFDGYPDPELPFMYHCHILRHEDMGMMGQFVVVASDATHPTRVRESFDGYLD